jgi:hypothetical protein
VAAVRSGVAALRSGVAAIGWPAGGVRFRTFALLTLSEHLPT